MQRDRVEPQPQDADQGIKEKHTEKYKHTQPGQKRFPGSPAQGKGSRGVAAYTVAPAVIILHSFHQRVALPRVEPN